MSSDKYSFDTIVAEYNGSLEAVDYYIHGVDTIWCYSSAGHPKLLGGCTRIATLKRWAPNLQDFSCNNHRMSAFQFTSMERLSPNPLPLQSIHRSGSSPKIQRRLPGKGAAAALIWSVWPCRATYGGGSSNKEISILGQPASTFFIVASRAIIPVEVPVPSETFIVDILIG
eukprot:scaffold9398_cov135-Skeletonema_dohrnii-CCMP3373.AAC.1